MSRRALFLALALLTLVSQVAVACHIPALDDEPVSSCQEGANHFCADGAPEHTGPCVLCQASAGSPALDVDGASESFHVAEPFVLLDESGPRVVLKFLPASPRAPPSL